MPRTPLLRLLLAAVAVGGLAATTVPAGAATPKTTVGSPSTPGTIKGFQLLGHTDLGNRGMNSPVAVAGECAYVGDREFSRKRANDGIAVVDVSNPRALKQVGRIPARSGITQRELRADLGLDLLLVLTYNPSIGARVGNELQVFDIRDCRRPQLVSTYDFGARQPHEFFLWKDRKNPGRALAYVATTLFGPDLTVVDVTDPRTPKLRTTYDLVVDQAYKAEKVVQSGSGYLHSIAVSEDGNRAYMGTWDFGTYVVDTSRVADPGGVPVITPASLPLDYGSNVHGTVPLRDRPYAVMVQEDYANAGSGCPFGHLRMADLSDPRQPKVAGEYKLPENDCTRSKAANGTFTAHNQTAFKNVALLTWYSGGLRAVDVSDPYRPVESGVFVPRARKPAPELRDDRLFFPRTDPESRRTGAMWSYPVVQDGLVYVVDIDLGLYVLRYTGKHAKEVSQAGFVEGNSSPSRWKRSDPLFGRTTPIQEAKGQPTRVKDPVPVTLRGQTLGFLC